MKYSAALTLILFINTEGDIWSFTTNTTTSSLITLMSPENDVTNMEAEVEFKWQADDTADLFNLQLATDNQFSDLKAELTDLVDPTYIFGKLEENTTYYWRVQAVIDGEVSGWSDNWSFSTALQTSIQQTRKLTLIK